MARQEFEQNREDIRKNREDIKCKKYSALREYVVHENSLINYRLTWLLVLQGFIFAAFGSLYKPIVDLTTAGQASTEVYATLLSQLKGIQYILGGLGFFTSAVSVLGVIAASNSIRKIEAEYAWVANQLGLPEVTGAGDQKIRKMGAVAPFVVPVTVAMAWLLVILSLTNFLANYWFPFLVLISLVALATVTILTCWIKLDR